MMKVIDNRQSHIIFCLALTNLIFYHFSSRSRNEIFNQMLCLCTLYIVQCVRMYFVWL
jgi:hypothetical protein